jgi:hypothetical protein
LKLFLHGDGGNKDGSATKELQPVAEFQKQLPIPTLGGNY